MKNKHTGFTLVELLVVIVIIGILATISIGTFQGYFVEARDAERRSTLRNVSNTIMAIRATKETDQYVFTDATDLGNALTLAGMKIPTRPGLDCYVYHHTADGSNFSIIAWYEGSEDDTLLEMGTPTGIGSHGYDNESFNDINVSQSETCATTFTSLGNIVLD